jgi:hypothetical protein
MFKGRRGLKESKKISAHRTRELERQGLNQQQKSPVRADMIFCPVDRWYGIRLRILRTYVPAEVSVDHRTHLYILRDTPRFAGSSFFF